jgi:ComF family protein
VYGGAIADAIVRFKFEKRPDLIERFAPVMAESARALSVDVVVPVPLHPDRLVARGYNQAGLLARAIARELEKPLAVRALVRVKNTPMQSTLGRSERLANLAAAFAVPGFKALRGRSVLLVDDVRTTGATLRACTAALHEVGVDRVFPLVLACADGSAV